MLISSTSIPKHSAAIPAPFFVSAFSGEGDGTISGSSYSMFATTSGLNKKLIANFFLSKGGSYNLAIHLTKSSDCPIVNIKVNDTDLGNIDLYGADFYNIVYFNNVQFATGSNKITIEAINKNPSSTGYVIRSFGAFLR